MLADKLACSLPYGTLLENDTNASTAPGPKKRLQWRGVGDSVTG